MEVAIKILNVPTTEARQFLFSLLGLRSISVGSCTKSHPPRGLSRDAHSSENQDAAECPPTAGWSLTCGARVLRKSRRGWTGASGRVSPVF